MGGFIDSSFVFDINEEEIFQIFHFKAEKLSIFTELINDGKTFWISC